MRMIYIKISLISREEAFFKQNFNSSRTIDQEYRRNAAVIENIQM
jgi:hypothetical protein